MTPLSLTTYAQRIAIIGLLAVVSVAQSAPPRPNIVVIITDDQGYGDLGIHGNPVLETPYLDALSRAGVSMQNFYVSTVCSPTRASLMTGRYNYRTRVVDTFKGRSMMEPAETTLPEVLRAAGYATGIFGKWHLGDNYPLRPTDQGFEEALTLRGGGLGQPSDPIENNRRYTHPIVFHNHRRVQANGFCTDVFFEGALAFIDEARRSHRPFFAHIALNAPHDPLHDVPPVLYEKYKAKELSSVMAKSGNSADTVARVYAMVENIDQNVGRLISRLRETGLLENTLVIFMSDNGPAGARFNGGLRGSKGDHYEGGIRTPFFVQWPGKIKPGTAPREIAAHIDVMPTLLEAAGVAPPADLKFDGRSLLPLLQGRATDWPDRSLVFQYHRGEQPIEGHNLAVRTQRWKLVRPTGRADKPVDAPFELYDLEADPGERTNLAAVHPGTVEQLRQAYLRWFADVGATRPDNYAPPRIVIGSDHETTTTLTRQDWRETTAASPGHSALGVWRLRGERDAIYSLELRWPQPVAGGTVEIRVGSELRILPVEQTSDRVVVDDLRVPAGDFDFSAVVRRPDSHDGAYHATLVRR
jgi:arylsulfatase A-like enzyme